MLWLNNAIAKLTVEKLVQQYYGNQEIEQQNSAGINI